MEGGNN
jgi:hypothetical protein